MRPELRQQEHYPKPGKNVYTNEQPKLPGNCSAARVRTSSLLYFFLSLSLFGRPPPLRVLSSAVFRTGKSGRTRALNTHTHTHTHKSQQSNSQGTEANKAKLNNHRGIAVVAGLSRKSSSSNAAAPPLCPLPCCRDQSYQALNSSFISLPPSLPPPLLSTPRPRQGQGRKHTQFTHNRAEGAHVRGSCRSQGKERKRAA